jgi:DNA-binding NarL/FixJ family response regulator
MNRSVGYTVIATNKTCFRCGKPFSTETARVCPACRRPRVPDRKLRTRELTFRERQVTALVSQAKLNKEIAFELRLTEGTVKEYLNRIFRKLDIKNRTELAMWAVRHHLAEAA